MPYAVKTLQNIDIIGKYPLWRTNEMGVMNVVINFMHNLWTAFPLYTSTGKILFDWCELNNVTLFHTSFEVSKSKDL